MNVEIFCMSFIYFDFWIWSKRMNFDRLCELAVFGKKRVPFLATRIRIFFYAIFFRGPMPLVSRERDSGGAANFSASFFTAPG